MLLSRYADASRCSRRKFGALATPIWARIVDVGEKQPCLEVVVPSLYHKHVGVDTMPSHAQTSPLLSSPAGLTLTVAPSHTLPTTNSCRGNETIVWFGLVFLQTR